MITRLDAAPAAHEALRDYLVPSVLVVRSPGLAAKHLRRRGFGPSGR